MMKTLGILMRFGLRRLLRPLKGIIAAAHAVAVRQREASLPNKASDEVGALLRAFRLVLARMAEREADLARRMLARTAELRLAASVVENTSEGVVVVNENALIVSVNAAFTAITGFTAEEAVGQKSSLLKSDNHDPEFYQLMWQTLISEGHWQGEIWNRRKGGEVYLAWLTINRIEAMDGFPTRYVSVFHDITEMWRKDERIRHLAFHDVLTGLPNRAVFQDRLQHAIDRAVRENMWLAVMFLDLDRFKGVNDTLGHDVGDLLLKEVALRLKTGLRSMDTVARLGGDEFVVLLELEDVNAADYSADIAADLIEAVSRPIEIQGHAIRIGVSVGIALCHKDHGSGCNAPELMKHADQAMYAAKTAGCNTYRIFPSEIPELAEKCRQMETELYKAVGDGEMDLPCPPKAGPERGCVDDVAALVR